MGPGPDVELDGVVTAAGGDVLVNVHVQPRAGRAGVVGRHGDALRVRVTAPPVGGRANDEVTVLLSGALEVARPAVSLVAGATSRVKRFRIEGLDADLAKDRLARVIRRHGA